LSLENKHHSHCVFELAREAAELFLIRQEKQKGGGAEKGIESREKN